MQWAVPDALAGSDTDGLSPTTKWLPARCFRQGDGAVGRARSLLRWVVVADDRRRCARAVAAVSTPASALLPTAPHYTITITMLMIVKRPARVAPR